MVQTNVALRLVVQSGEANSRLDKFLATKIPDCSRRFARRYVEQRLVTVNERDPADSQILNAGDVVEIKQLLDRPRARPELLTSIALLKSKITVLFEDEHLLAVTKARGVPSVTHELDDPITVADCLSAYCAQCREASPDSRESGLVQRLDTWTSGTLLAAKTPNIWQRLREMLFNEEIKKSYVALVSGEFEPVSGTISWPLRQSRDGKKMEAVKGAKRGSSHEYTATTKVHRVLVTKTKCSVDVSFVRCNIARARRHQVRAHLALAGHPLVGDELYGSDIQLDSLCAQEPSRLVELNPPGFFLHAEQIEFHHPISGKLIKVVASSDVLEALGIES